MTSLSYIASQIQQIYLFDLKKVIKLGIVNYGKASKVKGCPDKAYL